MFCKNTFTNIMNIADGGSRINHTKISLSKLTKPDVVSSIDVYRNFDRTPYHKSNMSLDMPSSMLDSSKKMIFHNLIVTLK
jgi:hypothetical protein